MKKKLCLILAAVLVCSLPLGAFAAETRLDAVVEGSIFSGTADVTVPVSVVFDEDWLVNGDNTAYNPDFAKCASLLAADVYYREKDLKKGTQNRVLLDAGENYAVTDLLAALGFSDVQYIESYKLGVYETDTNDSVTLLFAHKETEEADVYAAVIRGSFSIGEWLSAFDFGADTEEGGTHPEWADKSEVKGFSVAASRALSLFTEYRKAHDDPAKPDFALVTGHSRGGSIAGILGAALENDETVTPFTYTFSAAPETNDAAAAEVKTVFNLFDSGDFFTNAFPFSEEPLYRYGKDLAIDLAGNEDALKALEALLPGDTYLAFSEEMKGNYASLFGGRFISRAALYEPLCILEGFATEEEAVKREEELKTLIGSEAGLALESVCSVTREGSDVYLAYSGAAIMSALAESLAYGDAAFSAFASLFKTDTGACKVAAFLQENLAAVSKGHRLVSGYVLADFAE